MRASLSVVHAPRLLVMGLKSSSTTLAVVFVTVTQCVHTAGKHMSTRKVDAPVVRSSWKSRKNSAVSFLRSVS